MGNGILLSLSFSASKIARLKPFVKRVSEVVAPVFPSLKPETDASPELERLAVWLLGRIRCSGEGAQSFCFVLFLISKLTRWEDQSQSRGDGQKGSVADPQPLVSSEETKVSAIQVGLS